MWKEDFSAIIDKIYVKKDAESFRQPVDWRELGLDDYPTIIRKPMDLSTVRNNLKRGLYNSSQEAAADVRLIFMNAMTYNTPGSQIYDHAKSLRDFWEQSWARVSKEEPDLDIPPSQKEMEIFVDKCHRISSEDLQIILKHLDSNCPQCLIKRANTNEVEINFDTMTGKAFKEISKIIHSILPTMVDNSKQTPKNIQKKLSTY